MKNNKPSSLAIRFEKFAISVANATGHTSAFLIAFAIIIIWLICGPIFHFSDTWQLIINTGTSLVTFLMVFLIQKSQNKDTLALQVKLNELVAANALASNRIISVEDLTEQELTVLNNYYTKLAAMTKKGKVIHDSHSIEEAINNEGHHPRAKKSDDNNKRK